MKVTEIAQELAATKGTFWNKDPSKTILFANTAATPTEEEWGNAIPLDPREKFPMGVPSGKIFVKTTGGEAELAISGFFSSNGELREQIQNLSGYVNVLAVEDMYAIDILNASNKNIEIETEDNDAKTINLMNIPTRCNLYIELTYTYESAITWFNGINWLSGFAPTLYQGKTYGINFSTKDGGASWNGMLIGGW